jgi:hypothetical protein
MQTFYDNAEVIVPVLQIWAAIGGAIGYFCRGRTGLGAILGCLLGPLGWGIVLLLSDVRKRCTECDSVVSPRAKKCKKCLAAVA